MATLNQIVYNIASAQEKETDLQFVERVRFSVIYYGSMFIRRDQERNKILPTKSLQPMVCEMDKVNATELPGVKVGGEIWRSKEPIPVPIRLKTRDAIDYVGSVDKSEPYSWISPREASLLTYSTFTQKLPRYYINNGYLYVLNAAPKKVLLDGAWEDPTSLERFLKPDGTLAYSEDMEYPIPNDMIEGITKGLLGGELKLVGDDKPNEIKVDE